MYEHYKLCDELQPKEICLVVEQYAQGSVSRAYHIHVPQHRLSENSLRYLLQALVMKFEDNAPLTIVRGFLNDRGRSPSSHKFNWRVTYPEPGVLRKYCGGDTCAWADQVIQPHVFRPK